MPAYSKDPTALPEIVIGAPPAATTSSPSSAAVPGPAGSDRQHCVDSTIGNEPPSFGCLNEKLKRKVDEVNPTPNVPPIDAKSQDLKVGVVNVPAVQQQYGRNFGVSAVPYRPPVFFTPLGGADSGDVAHVRACSLAFVSPSNVHDVCTARSKEI